MRFLAHTEIRGDISRTWLCGRLGDGPIGQEETAEIWVAARPILVDSLLANLDPRSVVAQVIACDQSKDISSGASLAHLLEMKAQVRPSGFLRTASFTVFPGNHNSATLRGFRNLTKRATDLEQLDTWLVGFSDFDRAAELLARADLIYAFTGMNSPDVEFPFIFTDRRKADRIIEQVRDACEAAHHSFSTTESLDEIRQILWPRSA